MSKSTNCYIIKLKVTKAPNGYKTLQMPKNKNLINYRTINTHLTFETYKVTKEWQQKLKRGAMLYTQQSDLPWLYIGGQSGAGKSHICTAAATRLLQQGKVVKYVMWRDVFRKMESYRYEEEKYNAILKELEEVEVLVIDDFLKGMDISKQGSALEIAFDVINRRYNNKRPTIISSELQLVEVERLDKALFGRIKERCRSYFYSIGTYSCKWIKCKESLICPKCGMELNVKGYMREEIKEAFNYCPYCGVECKI